MLKESIINHHTALVYTMVIAAAADRNIQQTELSTIKNIIKTLPVFHDYDAQHADRAMGDCIALLEQTEGIDAALGLIKEALPTRFCETAYAIACDVVAADGAAEQEELHWLQLLRHKLAVNRLHAAAIERGARARYMRTDIK